jgi:hypothetical protein
MYKNNSKASRKPYCMKKHLFILIVFGLILGCENSGLKIQSCPKSYFTEPFPKRSINLALRLGDTVLMEIATASEPILVELNDSLTITQEFQIDTVRLGISFDRKTKHTTISDLSDRDTVFHGFVSKYRGIYYLTEKKTDSTYWIGAMNIDFDSIQGFGMIREQMCDLEDFVKHNLESEIIQRADTSNWIFEFNTDKKIIRDIYPNLIENSPKLKIISDQFDYASNDWEVIENQLPIDKKFELAQEDLVESVFPNPAVDFIEIVFNKLDSYVIQLINSSGKVVSTREIKDINLTIQLSDLDSGFYILRIYSPNDKLMETHRMIIK